MKDYAASFVMALRRSYEGQIWLMLYNEVQLVLKFVLEEAQSNNILGIDTCK